jgi:hypothetical protein
LHLVGAVLGAGGEHRWRSRRCHVLGFPHRGLDGLETEDLLEAGKIHPAFVEDAADPVALGLEARAVEGRVVAFDVEDAGAIQVLEIESSDVEALHGVRSNMLK